MTQGNKTDRFQMLALSGGGYRGLYTAQILADIEAHIGAPIASRFDLIAGTSIGGILALALACEIPAARLVDLFVGHGDTIFQKRFSLLGLARAPYDPSSLRQLIEQPDLLGQRKVKDCLHRVIVPAINYSTGKPVVFKTAHAPQFVRDKDQRLVDVALATSAAPGYFPRHTFDNSQYVDGGLFANAPGLLALHEAETVLGCKSNAAYLVAIGTMSSMFTVNPRRNRAGGTYDWGGWNPANMPKRLFGLTISAQESATENMLRHRLGGDRYLHIDDILSSDKSAAVALDKTGPAAREALIGAARERSKFILGRPEFHVFLEHSPLPQKFFNDVAHRKEST